MGKDRYKRAKTEIKKYKKEKSKEEFTRWLTSVLRAGRYGRIPRTWRGTSSGLETRPTRIG
jgi:hypothetical protein